MQANNPPAHVPDLPNAKAIRRFWTAWLVLLLAMLAAVILIVLVAAIVADPAHVSPAG